MAMDADAHDGEDDARNRGGPARCGRGRLGVSFLFPLLPPYLGIVMRPPRPPPLPSSNPKTRQRQTPQAEKRKCETREDEKKGEKTNILEGQMREARERHGLSFAQDDGAKSGAGSRGKKGKVGKGKAKGRKGAKRRRVGEEEDDDACFRVRVACVSVSAYPSVSALSNNPRRQPTLPQATISTVLPPPPHKTRTPPQPQPSLNST
ncbi:hypothetical protein B0H16DRAFT_1470376 [Mycena metata]|uniref:Uncharacterized protein n=1 Tax=Mycena metata TaxID=1033252 RepID=A0AAD7HW33_9AGAR|nr:hypothetical protein B0H16DRAFT_1470376 [Mycena metata]